MARRYSDIKRGAQLNARLNAYVTYLQNAGSRTPNLNSRGDRDPQRAGSVEPYGFDISAGSAALVNVSNPSFDKLNSIITTAADAAFSSPPASGAKKITGFTPAKVVYFENATKTKTVATSEITGGRYLKYSGTRYSMPFGKQADTSDLYDGFEAIRTAIKAAITNQEVQRISLTPERFRSV